MSTPPLPNPCPQKPIDADSFENASEVYNDNIGDTATYDLLDLYNDCVSAGGHRFLKVNGKDRCIYCGKREG